MSASPAHQELLTLPLPQRRSGERFRHLWSRMRAIGTATSGSPGVAGAGDCSATFAIVAAPGGRTRGIAKAGRDCVGTRRPEIRHERARRLSAAARSAGFPAGRAQRVSRSRRRDARRISRSRARPAAMPAAACWCSTPIPVTSAWWLLSCKFGSAGVGSQSAASSSRENG